MIEKLSNKYKIIHDKYKTIHDKCKIIHDNCKVKYNLDVEPALLKVASFIKEHNILIFLLLSSLTIFLIISAINMQQKRDYQLKQHEFYQEYQRIVLEHAQHESDNNNSDNDSDNTSAQLFIKIDNNLRIKIDEQIMAIDNIDSKLYYTGSQTFNTPFVYEFMYYKPVSTKEDQSDLEKEASQVFMGIQHIWSSEIKQYTYNLVEAKIKLEYKDSDITEEELNTLIYKAQKEAEITPVKLRILVTEYDNPELVRCCKENFIIPLEYDYSDNDKYSGL